MAKLRIYNSLTRKKDFFKPLKDKIVKLYVCGITPYDTTHLGHAFLYVHFDILVRYLTFLGYKVKYVQNVTDIDDDILRKAKEEGRDWQELGQFWTDRFLEDLKQLNVISPTRYVKATGSIQRIIEIIKELVDKEFAYRSGANVYFRVSKFKDYGKLSKYSVSEMKDLLSERGGNPNDLNKENPLDFILWQGKLPGEPFWNSPYGAGRPGWHIECSAMINEFLGDRIDIHGGGFDLIFPHHESEIAQSESFTGKNPFVNYWMHAAMVYSKKEKISKSLGNLIMVKDLLAKYSPNVIRWVILSHNYRDSWNFDEQELGKAQKILDSLPNPENSKINTKDLETFLELLSDDLNTKEALEEIVRLSKDSSKISSIPAALAMLGMV